MALESVDTKSPRHKWGEPKRFAAGDDGCEHNERVCKICRLVRITIIPPGPELPWHEWRTPVGKVFQMESTPPCAGGGQ